MSKKVLIGIGIVAVLAIVFFSVKGFPPTDEGTEGAIGAAKRYRAEQITDEDVVLQDPEVQELLQSDFFHKLVTDEQFRKAAVEQFNRLSTVSMGRAGYVPLQEMRSVVQLAGANDRFRVALDRGHIEQAQKLAIEAGRIDIADGLGKFQIESNRMNLESMKSVLQFAGANDKFRVALDRGHIEQAQRIAVAAGKNHIADGLGKFQIESNRMNLEGMKSVVQFAGANEKFRLALGKGHLADAQRIAVEQGRFDLADGLGKFRIESNRMNLEGMKSVVQFAGANDRFRLALDRGHIEQAQRIAVEQGKFDIVAGLGKFQVASNRLHVEGMKSIVQFAGANEKFRVALDKGHIEQAQRVAVEQGKFDIARGLNRFRLDSAKLNVESMKSLVEFAGADQRFRLALDKGHIEDAQRIAVKQGKNHIADGLGKFQIQSNRLNLESMKSIVQFAGADYKFRVALDKGHVADAQRIAVTAGKAHVADGLGKFQLTSNRMNLESMKSIVQFAGANDKFRLALGKGHITDAQRIAIEQGKFNLVDGLGKFQIQSNRLNMESMKSVAQFAGTNDKFRLALDKGHIEQAQRIAVEQGKFDLAAGLGKFKIESNRLNVESMKSVAQFAGTNDKFRLALDRGHIEQAQKIAVEQGKFDVFDGLDKFRLSSNRVNVESMKSIVQFAGADDRFRVALDKGHIEQAQKIAVESGRSDVTMGKLTVAAYMVGDSKSFVEDLNLLANIADAQSFRQAVDHPGFGKLVAEQETGAWKQAVTGVQEGRFRVQ